MEFASRAGPGRAGNGTNPPPLGKQWHMGWPDTSGLGGGNGDRTLPADQFSAAFGVRNLLDRELRRAVRLQHAHVLVVAMMAQMLVLMSTHPRIGIEELRPGLIGLMTGACAVLMTGACVVLPGEPASAGAARMDTASSAAEMVLNMVVSSSRGSRGSPAGWPPLADHAGNPSDHALNPA